jgi:hypothetical protein
VFEVKPMRIAYLLVAMGLGACAVDDAEEVEFAQESRTLESRVGTFLAEYSQGSNGTEIHAQFIVTRGISADQALEALDVWRPYTDLEIDVCALSNAQSPSGEERVSLELLDVGPITVETHDSLAVLEARRLPDIWDGVSGVVYGTERGFDSEVITVPYQLATTYTVSAPGAEISGFSVELEAPEVPEIIEHDFGSWSWVPAMEPADQMYVEVEGVDGQGRMVCRVEDDGEFVIPIQLKEAARVTLRRINVADLRMDGLDKSVAIFSSKNTRTISLRTE